MRIIIVIILILFVGLLSYQNIRFYMEWREVRSEHATILNRLNDVKKENENIERDFEYYQYLENIEKEARAQLNLKKPDEKVIIVIPKE